MTQLHFSTTINAPARQVWDTMLDAATYKQWCAVFCEGSYFEGSWQEGETIRFLGPNGSGMVSTIAVNRAPEFLSIKHIGFINNGVEDTDSAEVRSWTPAFENYTLQEHDGATEVKIDIDVTADFEQYMRDTWPRALNKLKELCEN